MDGPNFSFWDRLFRQVSESVWEDWLVKIIAAILASVLAALAVWLLKKIAPKIAALWNAQFRLKRGLNAVGAESPGIWLANGFRLQPPRNYGNQIRVSRPIIVVANLKGGVGKTTIAANLIGHYAIAKQERVLGIDLDFQGSLTANALSQANRDQLLMNQAEGHGSKSAQLIDSGTAEWLRLIPDEINGVPKGKLVSSYYSLAGMENRIMVEWLLGARSTDVRYHLAHILHDPIIQNSFDRIIIDAPPRLTTGCIQSLCAATHVLIPTVLDDLSAEAVGSFADQLRIHQELWPHLRIAGVVGTMIDHMPVGDRPLVDVEVDALAAGRLALEAALERAAAPLRQATFLPVDCFIPDKSELSKGAGHRIVYANPGQNANILAVRAIFDRLGDELDRRIDL